MTGTHVLITVDDLVERQMLDRQAQSATGNLMPRLGEYLQESTQNRFKTQTAPDGTAWAALKPAYARRKKYNNDKVLTLRGYLRSGIHFQVSGPNEVEVGTDSKYGAIHQFGGQIDKPERQATVRYRSVAGKILFAGNKHKRVIERAVTIPAHQINMPARPFLGISPADDREIRDIILDWVIERNGG